MKKQILLLWDCALSVTLILTILILSVKIDQFALAMMNPHHTIKFGLGVSLFVGCNILAFLSFTQVFKSTMNKHFKK